MADTFSRAKRSEVMARIRGMDTAPELAVRRVLHRLGYRFRREATTAGRERQPRIRFAPGGVTGRTPTAVGEGESVNSG